MDAYKKLEEKIENLENSIDRDLEKIAEYNILLQMPQKEVMKLKIERLLTQRLESYKKKKIELELLKWLLE